MKARTKIFVATLAGVALLIGGASFLLISSNVANSNDSLRSAAFSTENVRLCIQNLTGQNLLYDASDDNLTKRTLTSKTGTLGSQATMCAILYEDEDTPGSIRVGKSNDMMHKLTIALTDKPTFRLEISDAPHSLFSTYPVIKISESGQSFSEEKTIGDFTFFYSSPGTLTRVEAENLYTFNVRIANK